MEKTVDAALEQRRAIQTLRERGLLEDLSPKLKEAARLREEYPELSLSQLAELCDPPVTKSSLNHRLQKLIALSREERTAARSPGYNTHDPTINDTSPTEDPP